MSKTYSHTDSFHAVCAREGPMYILESDQVAEGLFVTQSTYLVALTGNTSIQSRATMLITSRILEVCKTEKDQD